jgi:hypothetical protein
MGFLVNISTAVQYIVTCGEMDCPYDGTFWNYHWEAETEARRHLEYHQREWARQNKEWDKTSLPDRPDHARDNDDQRIL